MKTLHDLPSTTAAMAILVRDHPVMAAPLAGLPAEEDDSVDAIRTDGITISVNPAFMAAHDEAGRVYMLAFMALSVAFSFIGRLGDRQPKVWGLASNMSVHLHLADEGVTGRPTESDGLFDPSLQGLTADEIYERLLDGRAKAFGMALDDVLPGAALPMPADA